MKLIDKAKQAAMEGAVTKSIRISGKGSRDKHSEADGAGR